MSPFEIMGDFGKKLYSEEEVNANLGIYLMVQYLKCHPVTLPLAEYLNSNWSLNVYQMYLLAYNMVPAGLRIKWIKTEKASNDEDVLLIQNHYVCGREVAVSYLELLTPSALDEIRKLYQHGSMKQAKGKK